MNHTAILSRAFEITRRHRSLWVIGFLLALTGGGGSAGSGMQFQGDGGGGAPGRPGTMDLPPALQAFGEQLRAEAARIDWQALRDAAVPLILAVICLALFFLVVAVVVSYVARAALVRMVDRIEDTGVAPTWREGLRLGRGARTLRLFLLELLVGLVFLFAVISVGALAIIAVAVVFGGASAAGAPTPALVFLGVGLILTVLPLVIVFAIAFSILRELWTREILLANRDIGAAFMESVRLLRTRLVDVVLITVLLFLAGLLFVAIFIPILLVALALAGGVGVAVGAAIYAVAGHAIGALALGGIVGVICLVIPVTFVAGLFQVFQSAAWTLAWRACSPAAMPPAAAFGGGSDIGLAMAPATAEAPGSGAVGSYDDGHGGEGDPDGYGAQSLADDGADDGAVAAAADAGADPYDAASGGSDADEVNDSDADTSPDQPETGSGGGPDAEADPTGHVDRP